MSPKLKPLLLPQLVESRRKLEEENDQCYVYVATDNLSSSDIASPVTPTFSRRGSHGRYSSSSSSLELAASSCSESPASPAPAVHQNAVAHSHVQHNHSPSHASINNLCSSASANNSSPTSASVASSATAGSASINKTPKRPVPGPLPDVQEEEPLAREDEEDTMLPEDAEDRPDLYDCLCIAPCVHHEQRPSLVHSATFPANEIEFDPGFLSDGDFNPSPRSSRKRRGGSTDADSGSRSSGAIESPFSTLTSRFSSKLPSLSRWRSTERRAANLAFSPASDPALDCHRPSMSIAPSSRSSSMSGRGRRTFFDRIGEPPLPPTPAMSLYESTENITLPAPLDVDAANAVIVGQSLEHDRAHATTPLLPPLMTKLPPSAAPSRPQSPLEFPKVEPILTSVPTSAIELTSPPFSPQYYHSPALSSKPSVSSFRHAPGSLNLSTPPTACPPDLPSPILNLTLSDPWSDRLGHANFTIVPKPYVPDTADLTVLHVLRADWDQARVNFTKHLVRTGEHYGTTSKTYQLTEAKWAETEQEWRAAHDSVVDRFAALCNGNGDPSAALRWRQEEVAPSAVPRILDEGKFPGLGDEDIVGPMVRDAIMTPPRDASPTRASSSSRFWRNLAGKVGLRK